MKRMRKMRRILFVKTMLLICSIFMEIASNPMSFSIISEMQVISPTNWAIELNLPFPFHDSGTVSLTSNRYVDTFLVSRVKTHTYSKVTYGVLDLLLPDSVTPTSTGYKFEIHKGDTVTVIFDTHDEGSWKERMFVSYLGEDSTICRCQGNTFLSGTPTIGSDNVLPRPVHKTLYVLSEKDSLPLSGIKLYKSHDPDSVIQETRSDGSLDVDINACGQPSFDLKDTSRDISYLLIFPYVQVENDTDTLYMIMPETNTRAIGYKKVPFSLSLVKTTSRMLFIVNGVTGISLAAQLRITTISGRLVKEVRPEMKEEGTYSISWDRTNSKGERLRRGVYFANLQIGSYSLTKKFDLE